MSRKNLHRLGKGFASVLSVNEQPLDAATRQQLEGELTAFMEQRRLNPNLPIPPALQEHMDAAMTDHPLMTAQANQSRHELIEYLLSQECSETMPSSGNSHNLTEVEHG